MNPDLRQPVVMTCDDLVGHGFQRYVNLRPDEMPYQEKIGASKFSRGVRMGPGSFNLDLAFLARSLLSLWLLLGGAVSAAADGGLEAVDGGKNASNTNAVSITADRQEVKLGEPVELTIEVKSSSATLYQLPPTLALQPFVELSRQEQKEVGSIQKFRIKVATFEEVGDLKVPSFSLVAIAPPAPDGGNGDGAAAEAQTVPNLEVPSLAVKVVSVLEGIEKADPRPAAPPVSIFIKDYRVLVFLGLVLLWLLLAVFLRKRRKPAAQEERLAALPPPRLAHEIGLEKLQKIMEENLLKQGRFQEFFSRVSETVREYIGNRYGFFALDLTTHELLEELRDRLTPGLDHALLRRMLEDADLVKFARLHPQDEMCSQAINNAFALVQATKLVLENQEIG